MLLGRIGAVLQPRVQHRTGKFARTGSTVESFPLIPHPEEGSGGAACLAE
jgi:hypothetical protein